MLTSCWGWSVSYSSNVSLRQHPMMAINTNVNFIVWRKFGLTHPVDFMFHSISSDRFPILGMVTLDLTTLSSSVYNTLDMRF